MQELNPAQMIRDDHERVRSLFQQLEQAGSEEKRELFLEVATEIEVHAKLEEEVFYPAVSAISGLGEKVQEGIEEHRKVEKLLEELKQISGPDGRLEAGVQQLQQEVEHHAREEEAEVLPRTNELADVEGLAQRMKELKEKLMLQAGARGAGASSVDELKMGENPSAPSGRGRVDDSQG